MRSASRASSPVRRRGERDQDNVPYWDCPECGGTAIVRCGCMSQSLLHQVERCRMPRFFRWSGMDWSGSNPTPSTQYPEAVYNYLTKINEQIEAVVEAIKTTADNLAKNKGGKA